METYDRKIRALPEVMRCLELCYRDECENCDYCSHGCSEMLGMDALFWLKELRTDNERLRKKLDILRAELAEERERSTRWVRESEPVVHAHWIYEEYPKMSWCTQAICSACHGVVGNNVHLSHSYGREFHERENKRCRLCGAHMDEKLELRTCYCPICDKHFEVRSNDSGGNCPDCGHHVVLHEVEVDDAEGN